MNLFAFFKKDFIKNVLTLITGSVISQIILYISILVLTRIFSTELFGIYMLFSSVTLILKPIATLQYEFSINLPKNDKDAINLFTFSLICLSIFSVLLFLVIFIFYEEILNIFEIDSLGKFIYFLPLSVFLFGAVSVFDYWNNRTNYFKNISNGLIVKSTIMSSSQIGLGLSTFNYLGLIPGMLLGQLGQLLFLVKTSFISLKKIFSEVSIKKMIILVKKYKDIPIFNTIINVTNTISNELPILLITKYFGLGNAGIFGLALKFTKAPVGIIQQSVNQVFFNRASKIANKKEGNLYTLILKTVKHLLVTATLIFSSLFIISFFLTPVFGENWSEVGIYVRILIPWLFSAFLANPISSLIVILNKQKTILYFDAFMLVVRFLALFSGYYFYNDILVSLVLFSIAGMVYNIVIFSYLLQKSKENKSAYN